MEPLNKSEGCVKRGRFRLLLATLLLSMPMLAWAASAPSINNTHSTSTTDESTAQPFISPSVTINSSETSVTVLLSLDNAGKGSFTTLGGFTDNGDGTYSFSGTPAAANSDLHAMVFTPAPNRVVPGTIETTTITITATDVNGSTPDSGTTIDTLSIDDAPALTGTTSNRNTTDKLATNLYAGFTVADVDQFGTQHVTVSIVQIRSTNGTLQLDSSGFTLSTLTPLTYSFEGTPTQATTGIRALSYRPTENIRPVGTNDITTFVVTVTDASGTDSSNSPFTNTVASLSINDPPVINGVSSTHQVLQTGRTNLPFAAAAITDLDVGDYTNEPNQHVSLQVSFAGMSGNGQWIPPAGLGFVSGSTYTLPVAKLSDATFALQHLAYQAQSFPISTTNTNTVTFTIVALDDHNGGATNTAAAVDIYTPYTPPGLSGTRSNQRVNDNASLALFSTVSIQSFNGGSFSVIINLSSDTNGSLINLSGFVRSGSNYVFTGSSEAATAAIRQLLFQPTNNRINGGTTDPTTFYITLVDGGVTSAPDSSTTVIVSPVNDAPVIQGISALVTITDTSTRNPFPTMSISDVDELGLQNLSVTVSIDNTNKGSFTTNSLAVSGFIANGVNYTRSGTPGQVTTAIRQLVFAPTHHLPSGATENTVFSVVVFDGQGGTAANSQTTIRVAALGGGPVFNLPTPQPVSLPLAALLNPFSSSTVSDPQNLVLTVQLTNSTWGSFTSNSLAAGGFTNVSPGTYRVSGPDTNVTTYLQGLEFAPNTNLALGTVIVFNLNAVNQTGNATSTNLAITLRLNLRSLIVTKTSDYDPNDGSVTDAQKGGTLRKAIQDAGSNDHITFDIRSLSAGLPDYPATINLKKNLILNNNVVFDGPGADLLSISGDTDGDGIPDQQIFEVNAQVVINKLTFTKGHHPFSGGAIEVNPEGTLKLSYCAITDSSADVWGGGIDVNGGSLAMDHCLITGNSTSASFGQGGGGLSLYSDQRCDLVNCTFAANQQLAPSGLGGGAVYAETIDSGVEFDVFVHSCTFHENFDAAGHGSSVRPNVFNTEVFLQNTIVADGHGKNLEMDQSGDVISLGGNISDDGTTSIFSMGGVPYDTTIFSQPPDFTNRVPNLLALADNHGPTFTYGLAFNSAAINTTVSNTSAALFYNTLATDQRSYWRTDGSPDIGAFERNASQRVLIEEILFADTNHQFIEFYVPRDSAALNLDKFKVLLHGQLLHTFTNANLLPGEALVLFARNAPNIAPTNVLSQIASSNLLMDVNADTITLLNPSNQVVLEVSYVGTFTSSDPNDAGFLTASNQSIVLSPPFQGCYLPYQRVVAHATGQTNVAGTSNPGFDPFDAPLGPGNAPPRAFDDFAATDAQTALPIIPVLNNDKDPDISDAIRVVGVGVTNVIEPGVTNITSTSHYGAAILINSNGLSIGYDPRVSQFLTSLPQGSNVVDWFQYTIQDSSNGVDHVRGTTSLDISNNIVKATATVSVSITGVNLPPTPQDDGTNTTEDVILDFTTADTILANDTDPNTDDNSSTLTIISIEPTSAYQNSLQAITTLGAFATLDIRFNRNQTHITYDPRGSSVLNSLAVGQTAVDTFYYSVRDRYGAIGTAAIHITVIGVNDTPGAQPDFLTGDEDTVLTIPAATLLANDIDPDTGITNPVAPHLIVSAVDAFSALGAHVQIAGTNIIYDPTVSSNLNALARKESVVDTFTYTARDDSGATSNAIVSITVAGRNDTPIPLPDLFATGEKILLPVPAPGVLANDRDPDVNGVAPDDTIRVIPFTNNSTMGAPVVMNADGSFSYDPRGVFDWLIQGQMTNDTFSYTLMDHSFSIANDDSFSVQGNSSANVLPVLGNDALLSAVGGALTVISVSPPTKAGTVAIDSAGHNLIYSPSANYVGIETFSYVVSDGFGGTDFATVTVTVTVDALNGNLVANSDSFTVAKGTTVTLDVLANDNILPASGAALTILAVSTPSQGGSVTINGGAPNNTLTYAPNSANTFPLTETFSYVVSGGGIARATGTVSVAVFDLSNTLTANEDTFSVIANGANYPLDVLANDLILPGPNTNLTITSIQTNGVNGIVSVNATGTGLLYRPPSGVTNHQEPVITYAISNAAGATSFSTVSIFVLSDSSSGFFANDDVFSITKNSQSNSLAVLLNDAFLPNTGQVLTITDIGLGTNSPNHGGTVTINPSAKALIYTPTNNFVGDESFTYEISYGTVERAQGRVFVHVVDTATLPSNPDRYSVAKNSTNDVLPVLKNDYPLPRTLLALTLTGLQTNGIRGTVAINGNGFNNSLLYTPANGFIGREVFGYESSDGRGNKGTNQVTVIVGNLTPHDDQFSVLSGSANNPLDVLTNDPVLPDTTTVRPISGLGIPDHGGTVATNGGATMVLYTPATGFIGTENFTYQIRDDAGGIFSAKAAVTVLKAGSDRATNTVTVTLTGTNDPPTITGISTGLNITDKQTIQPFTNVVIADVDARGLQILTVIVRLDNAIKGALQNLGGFSLISPGAYQMVGLGSNITASIRGMTFVPVENRITVPTTEATTFTISAYDGYITVSNSATKVNVTAVNDPPLISGTLGGQCVYDHLTLRPFIGVTITEVDDLTLQSLTITVSLAQPTFGFLTSLGGFTGGSNGAYTLTAATAAQAATALRGLLYVPTPGGRLALGGMETNRLTITVNDSFAAPVIDNITTIISKDSFIKKLMAGDGSKQDAFGYSVSAERDLVVVGTPNDPVGSIKSGSAYLYSRNLGGSDAWNQLKKISGGDPTSSDQFGFAVGISGDTIVVGAPNGNTNGTKTGAIYIFERNQGGPNNWGQTKKIAPVDGSSGDQFGDAVAINVDTIVVGAHLNKPGNFRSGSAYVYGRNQGGTGAWGLVRKLVPTDGADLDDFAFAVSLNGDTAVVGAQSNTGNGNKGGAAYVFDRNQGGANNWGQTRRLTAPDVAASGSLGHAVTISGDLILVGAPFDVINTIKTGSAYGFSRNQGGTNQWGQVNKFIPADGVAGGQFGFSVTLDGELFVIGSNLDIDHGLLTGAVYIYVRNYPGLNQWSLVEKLVPPVSDQSDQDGFALSLSQNTLAVGAHFDDSGNNRFGVTYIYRLKCDNAPFVPKTIPDQFAMPGVPFVFAIPAGTFADPDINDTLTLSLSFFPAPPVWLAFNPATGTFSGTPDSTVGTFPVVVRATDQDGASITVSFNIIVGTTSPALRSAKVIWQETYFSAVTIADPSLETTVWGENADPDGDGVSNIQEYLFGTDPLTANPGDAAPVQITPSGNPNTMLIAYNRRTDDWRLVYYLQTTDNLNNGWQTVDPAVIVNQSSSVVSFGVERIVQEVMIAGQHQFFCVKVQFLVPE